MYTLPIIILELLWDAVFFSPGNAVTATQNFAVAFARAALLEEAVKFFFCYRVIKRHPELDLKEAILMAGVVGIGYGFTEKLVYFNPLAMITNALIPGHMIYQWFMGFWIYKALHAKGTEQKKKFSLAFGISFMIHGLWDFALDIPDFIMESSSVMMILGGLLVIAMIILMIVITIIAAKRIRNISEKTPVCCASYTSYRLLYYYVGHMV